MIIGYTKLEGGVLCVLGVYPGHSDLGKVTKSNPMLSKYKCTKAKVMHMYHQDDINSSCKEFLNKGVDLYNNTLVYEVGKVLDLKYNDCDEHYITFFLIEELANAWKNNIA